MLNLQPVNKCYAFFDVDDTVISVKSLLSFVDLYFQYYPDDSLQQAYNEEMERLFSTDTDWKTINTRFYSYFKHFPISQVNKISQQWFTQHSANKNHFYHKNVLNILKAHQSNGVECVFVSGSFRELLQPIADDLGIKHILSINLVRDGLLFTGEIHPPQTIGAGKATAIHHFLAQHKANACDCYAYGDDISDVPMLEVVGKPFAIDGGRRLTPYAQSMGWEVIQPY